VLFSDAVAKVAAEGGFDSSSSSTSTTTILGWVVERVRSALAESKYRRVIRDLGPTVAGDGSYALTADIVDVRMLRVGSSTPYAVASPEHLWEIEAGDRVLLAGTPGVFVGNFEADADATIDIYPVPSTAGQAISALVAVVPAAADLELADTIPLPDDVVERIAVDGAIATGMARVYARHDDAQAFEARYRDGVQVLARRANSRVGGGAVQIPIVRPGRY
jgi:hypothetical protein